MSNNVESAKSLTFAQVTLEFFRPINLQWYGNLSIMITKNYGSYYNWLDINLCQHDEQP